MKTHFAFALCAVFLFGAPVAASADVFDGFTPYANIGVGTFSGGQISINTATGRLGARFGSYFGVEGDVSIGLDRDHFFYALPCHGFICPPIIARDPAKLDNAEAGYAIGFFPVLPNADLFARVGYGTEHFSAAIAPGGGFDRDGVKFGGGAQYFIDGQNGLRIDYTRTEFQGGNYAGREALGHDADEWTLAFTHQF